MEQSYSSLQRETDKALMALQRLYEQKVANDKRELANHQAAVDAIRAEFDRRKQTAQQEEGEQT